MPGDVQLTSLAVKAAPLDYVVPGSAVVRVKSIHALYTDNSAGGDWLPAVRLISDSGHTIAIASDQGSKVAAGGDAAASFFPGVKAGGGAVTINEQAALWLLSTDTPYTVAAGLTDTIVFPRANFFNSAITVDAASGRFELLKRWQFFFAASVLWENANFPRSIWISTNFGHGGFTLPQPTDFHVRTPDGTFTTSDPTGLGPLWCHATMMVQPDSFATLPLRVELDVQNGDAVDRNIVQAYYACYAVNFTG